LPDYTKDKRTLFFFFFFSIFFHSRLILLSLIQFNPYFYFFSISIHPLRFQKSKSYTFHNNPTTCNSCIQLKLYHNCHLLHLHINPTPNITQSKQGLHLSLNTPPPMAGHKNTINYGFYSIFSFNVVVILTIVIPINQQSIKNNHS
jgi:hypothetical protein